MTSPAGWRRVAVAAAAAVVAVAALLAVRAACTVDALATLRDAGDGRRAGSILLPRPGRYVFGVQAPGPVTLVVDGRRLALRPGAGARVDTTGVAVDLPAKVAAVEVQAPAGTRLLWHPPGRRGPLEYLPASSVSPAPPEAARFGPGAGARRLDGWIALGAVLAAAAAAAWAAWPRLRRTTAAQRRVAGASLAVAGLALAVRLWDLGGAGQTFDEDVAWAAGRNYLENLLSLDGAPASWVWNYEHPPVSKYLAGFGALWADGYGPARAVAALCMALACGLVVAIGARLWCIRAGLAAGLIAALTPHLVAHGKVAGHEAPTALWWALATCLALRAHDGLGGDGAARRRDTAALAWRLVGLGVVLGLALSTRFVNALLAPLLGAVLLVRAPAALRGRTVALGLAVLPTVALVVCVAVWPRLWSEPVAHLEAAWGRLGSQHAPEPFLGSVTASPPRWYFVAYLYATAPLGVLALAGAWLVRAATRPRREGAATLCALALLAAPLLVAASPVRQDGVRYVIPSLLGLALVAGAGLDWVIGRLARGPLAARPAAVAAATLVAVALYLGAAAARVHPYYLDYYGEQVGGPRGVARARSHELGWWGEGVDRAVAYVAAHAGPGDRVYRDCVEAVHLAWWHAEAWATFARTPAQADWIVVQPAWRPCAIPPEARLVHEVTADGAPLVRVYRRKPPAAPPPPNPAASPAASPAAP